MIRMRKVGSSTWYFIRLDTKVPVSPDFRDKGLAMAWIKKNHLNLVFEMTVLGQ